MSTMDVALDGTIGVGLEADGPGWAFVQPSVSVGRIVGEAEDESPCAPLKLLARGDVLLSIVLDAEFIEEEPDVPFLAPLKLDSGI